MKEGKTISKIKQALDAIDSTRRICFGPMSNETAAKFISNKIKKEKKMKAPASQRRDITKMFGKFIKHKMTTDGLNTPTVSKLSGVHVNTIRKVIKSKHSTDLDRADLLLYAVGGSWDEFLGWMWIESKRTPNE